MPIVRQQPATLSFLVSQGFCVLVVLVVLQGAMKFKTAEEALGFYGVYHREPLNQLIHFFGVPGIIWSLLIFMAHVPFPFLGSYSISIPFVYPHPLNWATCLTLFYFVFNMKIDPYGGSLYAPVVYAMYASSVNLWMKDQEEAKKVSSNEKTVSWTGTGKVIQFAAIVQFLSWYVQIHPGHGILEGAKPAVLDSVGGALTSAPLFAFYEGLWFLGINKELQQRTLEKVAEHTIRMCAEGAAMRVCESL